MGINMNLVKGFKHTTKSGQEYESVEDQKDLRIPVQNEDAFKHGIVYKAKYIGTQEITRPSSRVEIVSAMRRIRYEYKYRNIKKRKVNMDISVEGIQVTIWKKKKLIEEGKYCSTQLFVMCYPINRVFYVSHDSQDLLIFSYIARGEDGIFRCSVFKSFKKSQAMNIVRTIGQAFEVCHKINVEKANEEQETEDKEMPNDVTPQEVQDNNIDEYGETDIDDTTIAVDQGQISNKDNSNTLVTDIDKAGEGTTINAAKPNEIINGEIGLPKDGNFYQWQQIYLQQLRHQKYEADAAKAEVQMLKQQLRIESDTRRSAQARIEQLLSQNRELLTTVQKLMLQAQKSSAKDVFDPIDELWLTAPVTDAYFPRIVPNATPPNQVTNDCISGVYGNIHHQSIDFESAGITAKRTDVPSNRMVVQHTASEVNTPILQGEKEVDGDLNGSFSDLRKEENDARKQGARSEEASREETRSEEAKNEDAMLESAGERQGGISSSFNDLTTVGVEDNNVDVNHNADRITKFKRKEDSSNESKTTEQIGKSPVIPGNSPELPGISREMMETFSQELDELKGKKMNGIGEAKATSSVTDL